MGKITPNSAILAIELRLWYRTLSGAHQDINNRLNFPHLFVSRPSEILKYGQRKLLSRKC